MLKRYSLPVIIIVNVLLMSCADVRKTIYFADQKDGVIPSNITPPKSLIQPNDILSIAVSSLNAAATSVFNTPNISATTTTGNVSQTPGYLVNNDGFIQFPILGNVKAAGLTTNQLRVLLTNQLVDKKLLTDPIVAIRQLNFRVSVLGEVARPTVINVPSEKISLLEALGLAGDITVYGRKDNVTVIREEDGIKNIKRLDLNSSELFNSPYYYLKSNDIVYVEANRSKIASTGRGVQTLPIILSALSLVAIVVGVIYRR